MIRKSNSSYRAIKASTVSMTVVRTLVDSVVEAGVPRSTFLRAAQLDSASVQVLDARFPRSNLYELCELALELTRDPAFGLHSVERMATDALNPIGALVVHAATLEEALRSIQEFRCLLGDEASFRLYEDGERVIVRVNDLPDERPHVRRFWTEVGLAGLYRTIRRFGPASQIHSVDFAYGAPDYREEYARIFEGQARFDRPFTGLSFDRRLMSASAPHPDAELHSALRTLAVRRVTHLTDGKSYAERVHQLLVWQRPPRDMRMESAARALGLSVRSLRRHLTAEGKRYPDLVHEALALIAKTCLLDERRTIVDTALELGFADNTGFHRAFKRWTGLTPGAATAQARSESSKRRC